ncbi:MULTISPECIES: LLM class flavin-dependent oxidoreductase [Gordonia]|uniref:LLM class flavin-dependent oxidoreductase n=1 Tax=Gordonia TaxID=2053 RepID=UPI000AFBFD7C|nr:LLM class flavin-dependent oxidoreductase [Gordonia sp. 852002-10350_SCH5691597]
MLNRVDALAEACEWIRGLWTEDDPFDFTGGHVVLTGAVGNPKPQRPHPPLLIGGLSQATLRVEVGHRRRQACELTEAGHANCRVSRFTWHVSQSPVGATVSHGSP